MVKLKEQKFSVEVVDGHAPEVISLSKKLSEKGFKVFEAFDAVEAINIAKKEKPDIIISDIQLDCLNGFDVARMLPDQKIFFIT